MWGQGSAWGLCQFFGVVAFRDIKNVVPPGGSTNGFAVVKAVTLVFLFPNHHLPDATKASPALVATVRTIGVVPVTIRSPNVHPRESPVFTWM